MSPADELASTRVQIARLKARERALRQILVDDVQARSGRWTRAEVVETRIRVFDHRLLPAPIREDPAYWRSRPLVEVLCHEIEDSATQAPVALTRGAAKPLGLPLQ